MPSQRAVSKATALLPCPRELEPMGTCIGCPKQSLGGPEVLRGILSLGDRELLGRAWSGRVDPLAEP